MASFCALFAVLVALAPGSLSQEPETLQVSFNEVNERKFAFDARLTEGSLPCGARRRITNTWEEVTNQYWERQGGKGNEVNTQAATFTGGRLTIPVDGVYLFFGSGRCETGSCDVTLRLDGTRVAAFGTDIIQRRGDNGNTGGTWASHSVSTIQRATAGQRFDLFFESGASSDCIQETEYYYAHMGALLIFADSEDETNVN